MVGSGAVQGRAQQHWTDGVCALSPADDMMSECVTRTACRRPHTVALRRRSRP